MTGTIYWYGGGTALRTLETDTLSDLQVSTITDSAEEYTREGRAVGVYHHSLEVVRLVVERFSDAAQERELRAIERHLHRGGWIGLSADHDRTWCARVTTPPQAGDTTIHTVGTALSSWSSSAALIAGDEVVIESVPPECHADVLALATPGALLPVLDEPVRVDFGEESLFRWRYCWPTLRLAARDRRPASVLSERGVNYTLDITLEYSVAAALELCQAQGSLLGPTGGRGATLESILGGTAARLGLRIEPGPSLARGAKFGKSTPRGWS